MDRIVDNLNEDEAERESLLAKPTCFIIVGRPVISLSFTQTTQSCNANPIIDEASEQKALNLIVLYQIYVQNIF